jgi:hypothetical protein
VFGGLLTVPPSAAQTAPTNNPKHDPNSLNQSILDGITPEDPTSLNRSILDGITPENEPPNSAAKSGAPSRPADASISPKTAPSADDDQFVEVTPEIVGRWGVLALAVNREFHYANYENGGRRPIGIGSQRFDWAPGKVGQEMLVRSVIKWQGYVEAFKGTVIYTASDSGLEFRYENNPDIIYSYVVLPDGTVSGKSVAKAKETDRFQTSGATLLEVERKRYTVLTPSPGEYTRDSGSFDEDNERRNEAEREKRSRPSIGSALFGAMVGGWASGGSTEGMVAGARAMSSPDGGSRLYSEIEARSIAVQNEAARTNADFVASMNAIRARGTRDATALASMPAADERSGGPRLAVQRDAGGIRGMPTADGGIYVGNGVSSVELEAFTARQRGAASAPGGSSSVNSDSTGARESDSSSSSSADAGRPKRAQDSPTMPLKFRFQMPIGKDLQQICFSNIVTIDPAPAGWPQELTEAQAKMESYRMGFYRGCEALGPVPPQTPDMSFINMGWNLNDAGDNTDGWERDTERENSRRKQQGYPFVYISR